MTIGSDGLNSLDSSENAEPPEVKQVSKVQKAHSRSVVGVHYFLDAISRKIFIATLSHESTSLWELTNDNDLIEFGAIKSWPCGIQSWDASTKEKLIAVVGVDSTSHVVEINLEDVSSSVITKISRDLMEAWFVRISPDKQHFLTVNFSGHLQLLDKSGQVIRSAIVDKIKQTSSIIFGNKFIILGSTQGLLTVVDSNTFYTLYLIEGHSMKIRCLIFSPDQRHILTGADDKTIKLYTLMDNKGVFVRTFCGHKSSIQCIAIDSASMGERFASCSSDTRIIIWRLSSGEKLNVFDCVFSMNDILRCVAFSPTGNTLVAGTEEANIFVFSLPQPENAVDVFEVEEPAEHSQAPSSENGHFISDSQSSLAENQYGNNSQQIDDGELERRELEMELGID